MNSCDPFAPVADKRVIMANVQRWRLEHKKPLDPGFKNAPVIIIPKKKTVVAAVDSILGKEGK